MVIRAEFSPTVRLTLEDKVVEVKYVELISFDRVALNITKSEKTYTSLKLN